MIFIDHEKVLILPLSDSLVKQGFENVDDGRGEHVLMQISIELGSGNIKNAALKIDYSQIEFIRGI